MVKIYCEAADAGVTSYTITHLAGTHFIKKSNSPDPATVYYVGDTIPQTDCAYFEGLSNYTVIISLQGKGIPMV